MRHLLALPIAAIIALALATPALAADPVRPFAGVTVGVDSMAAPAGCPEGYAWRYVSIGSGQIRHLGRVDMVVSHCSRFTGPTSGAFGDGTITFTAANGDTLVLSDWGTFELVMGPDEATSFVDLRWKVIGGTGRFAGATGHGGASPVGDLMAGITSAAFWGEIAY